MQEYFLNQCLFKYEKCISTESKTKLMVKP